MIYGDQFIMEKKETGDRRIDSGNEGERKFVQEYRRCKYKSNLVCMPHFGRTDPDFLICSPEVGFMICEVKNVKLHNIQHIEPNGKIHYGNQKPNPWIQVKKHRDSCADFIHTTYGNDLYKFVYGYVVFTSITKSNFQKKFASVIKFWKKSQMESFFERFKFVDEIPNYQNWNNRNSEPKSRIYFDFSSFCEQIRPDFTSSPNHKINVFLDSENLNKRFSVINFQVVTQVDVSGIWCQYRKINSNFRFKRYYEIRKSILDSLQNTIEKNQNEIKTEIIKQQKKLSELQAREKDLDNQVHILTEKYCVFISDSLNLIFESKRKSLSKYIEEQYKWHHSITENVTQVAVGAALIGSKVFNHVSSNGKFEKKIEDIDLRTNIQRKFDSLTDEEVLRNQVEKIIRNGFEKYSDDWQAYLKLGNLFERGGYEYQFSGKADQMSKSITETQLAFVSGITTTVIATAGLAAGWHTMAYAVSSIVPAGLAITTGLTLFSALSSKGKRVNVIQNEVVSILENYRYAVRENVLENRASNGMTIREWFTYLGEEVKAQVVDSFEKDIVIKNIVELESANQVLQNEVNQIQILLNTEC